MTASPALPAELPARPPRRPLPVIGASRRVAPGRVLAVASAGAGLAFVDATIVNVAFPDMQADFAGTSLGALSWILNAYNIVFAAFLVAAGRLADLLGRRRTFHAGVILFTVASALCAVAPTVELLVAARVLQALGAAITVPASLALVLNAYPPDERAHGVALWTAGAALAAGLGPSVGGALVELGGWRLAFLVNLPLGIAAFVAGRRVLVESRAPGRRTLPDLAGAGVAALAIGALTLGIVQGEEWGWTSPPVLAAFAAAPLLLAVFVRRCRRHPSPMLDLDLLRIRTLSVANVLSVVAAAGFYAYVLNNVLFLTSVWGYSVLDAGLALSAGPFVAAAVARPASRLAARVGYRPVLVVGGLTWAAGLGYMATRVGVQPAFVAQWLPGMLLLGVGAGLTFPLLSGAAVASAPGERFATATSLSSVSRQLGAVLGVALLIVVVGTPQPAEAAAAFDRGWLFSAACMLVVAVGALALGRVAAAAAAEAPSGSFVGPAARLALARPAPAGLAAPEPARRRPGHDRGDRPAARPAARRRLRRARARGRAVRRRRAARRARARLGQPALAARARRPRARRHGRRPGPRRAAGPRRAPRLRRAAARGRRRTARLRPLARGPARPRPPRRTRRRAARTCRRPRRPPPDGPLGRAGAVGRRRPRAGAHRRDRGAARRGDPHRPRRRHEHGRVHRGAVRHGPRPRGDRGALLRGVGAAQPADRLPAAARLAPARRAGAGAARAHACPAASRRSRSTSSPSPATSSPARSSSIAAARSRTPSERASASRASCRRSRSTGAGSSTAACSTTSRST